MDGGHSRDELYGMTVEDMEEIAKRQELEHKYYFDLVCSKCPTKNCLKREDESEEDYRTREILVGLKCENQNIIDYLLANVFNTQYSYFERLKWENCKWNK